MVQLGGQRRQAAATGGARWSTPTATGFLNFNGGDELLGVTVNACARGPRLPVERLGAAREPHRLRRLHRLQQRRRDQRQRRRLGGRTSRRVRRRSRWPAACSGTATGGPRDREHRRAPVQLAVRAPPATSLELLVERRLARVLVEPYSATQPISDSANPGVVSVGAIDPWHRAPTLAYYSSQGPTNDGRMKPDISAPSVLRDRRHGGPASTGPAPRRRSPPAPPRWCASPAWSAEPPTRARLPDGQLRPTVAAPGVDNVTG